MNTERNVYMKEIKMHLVDEILCKLETADNTTKSQLENKLVAQGSAVVPEIGEASIDCLRKAASDNKDFEWVAKYLISEIQAA